MVHNVRMGRLFPPSRNIDDALALDATQHLLYRQSVCDDLPGRMAEAVGRGSSWRVIPAAGLVRDHLARVVEVR